MALLQGARATNRRSPVKCHSHTTVVHGSEEVRTFEEEAGVLEEAHTQRVQVGAGLSTERVLPRDAAPAGWSSGCSTAQEGLRSEGRATRTPVHMLAAADRRTGYANVSRGTK